MKHVEFGRGIFGVSRMLLRMVLCELDDRLVYQDFDAECFAELAYS